MITEGKFGDLESILEAPLPELASGSIDVATCALKQGLFTPKRAAIECKYNPSFGRGSITVSAGNLQPDERRRHAFIVQGQVGPLHRDSL